MLPHVLAALLAVQNPQAGPVDAPVYEDSAGGVALPRPWDDWVFEPARSRGMTTVILHPRNGSLSSQLWGSLVVTTLNRSIPLPRLVDERVFQSWQPTLGPTFAILTRDSLTVQGLPAMHVVMSGVIARTALDVEEYLIARGGDLIVLQFRYPRALPRDSIALGYERAFSGLRIRGAPGVDTVSAAAPPPEPAAPPGAPPPASLRDDGFVPHPAAEMWARLGGSPWRVERIEARLRLADVAAPPELEVRLDLLNDGLAPVDQVPLWIPRTATLDSVRVGSARVFNGGDVAPLGRVPLGDTIAFQGRASVTLFYRAAPIGPSGVVADDWLPAVQSPYDSLGHSRPAPLPRITLTFDVPGSLAAIATGHLTADLTTDARRRSTWVADGVAAAHPAFAIGGFTFAPRSAGRLSLALWTSANAAAAADSCARLVSAAWAFGARAFGLVMAPEVTVVIGVPVTRGFPGLLFLTPEAARDPSIVMEEMARTWWGGAVRGAGEGDAWIDFGFPAWVARAAAGDTAAADARSNSAASGTSLASAVPQSGADIALMRAKGAAALEALRHAVGESRFREIIRTLATEHRGGSITANDVAAAGGDAAQAALRPFLLGN